MTRRKRGAWLPLAMVSFLVLMSLVGCGNIFSLFTGTTTTTSTTTTTVTEVEYYSISNYTTSSQSGSVLDDGVYEASYVLVNAAAKANKLYVLNVDPSKNDDITLRVGSPDGYVRGLATTTELATYIDNNTTDTVLGGVNADFFDITSGGPLGFTMTKGRWLTTGEFTSEGTYTATSYGPPPTFTETTATYTGHPGYSFGIKADGTAVIAQPVVTMTFDSFTSSTQDHDDTAISILNALRADATKTTSQPANALRSRADNFIVLYTPDYATSTNTAAGGVEVTFSTSDTVKSDNTISGTVTAISADGNVPLVAGTMVLSGYGTGATALGDLAVGDTITISVDVNDAWDDVVECVGGGRPDGAPILVKDGALVGADYSVYEEYSGGWYNNNPRTAVGVRADGSYFFFVVDGRQTGISDGATIDEMAQFALDLGATIAINFDGGRSSSMITATGTKGSYNLVNIPAASGVEREDGNGIFVVTK
ncbi:MAG TPA: phosphodiester glycosidase family protein [Rectinemataceae bacterium]|nr:phosphodiester glycosidase family protein [Rectinemataceae bacterium]